VTPRQAGTAAVTLLIWLAAVAVVIGGELLPGDSTPMVWVGSLAISDKLMHFGAYVVLAFIPCLGFPLRTGIALSAALIGLGVGLEFAQKFVPGRSYDMMDAVANTLGVILGSCLGALASRLHASRKSEPVKTNTHV
jgi:hypothetical protein